MNSSTNVKQFTCLYRSIFDELGFRSSPWILSFLGIRISLLHFHSHKIRTLRSGRANVGQSLLLIYCGLPSFWAILEPVVVDGCLGNGGYYQVVYAELVDQIDHGVE